MWFFVRKYLLCSRKIEFSEVLLDLFLRWKEFFKSLFQRRIFIVQYTFLCVYIPLNDIKKFALTAF